MCYLDIPLLILNLLPILFSEDTEVFSLPGSSRILSPDSKYSRDLLKLHNPEQISPSWQSI